MNTPTMLDELLEEEARHNQITQDLGKDCRLFPGEIVVIRGGVFRVHAVTQQRVYLDFVGQVQTP